MSKVIKLIRTKATVGNPKRRVQSHCIICRTKCKTKMWPMFKNEEFQDDDSKALNQVWVFLSVGSFAAPGPV